MEFFSAIGVLGSGLKVAPSHRRELNTLSELIPRRAHLGHDFLRHDFLNWLIHLRHHALVVLLVKKPVGVVVVRAQELLSLLEAPKAVRQILMDNNILKRPPEQFSGVISANLGHEIFLFTRSPPARRGLEVQRKFLVFLLNRLAQLGILFLLGFGPADREFVGVE